MNKYLSIITLNINGLFNLFKIHKLPEWIRKHNPYMLSTRGPPQNKRSTQVANEAMEKIFQANRHEKKCWDSNIYIRQNRL